MSAVVEGVGDEVLFAFATLIIAIIVSLVWLSTNVRENNIIQAVIFHTTDARGRPVREITIRNRSASAAATDDDAQPPPTTTQPANELAADIESSSSAPAQPPTPASSSAEAGDAAVTRSVLASGAAAEAPMSSSSSAAAAAAAAAPAPAPTPAPAPAPAAEHCRDDAQMQRLQPTPDHQNLSASSRPSSTSDGGSSGGGVGTTVTDNSDNSEQDSATAATAAAVTIKLKFLNDTFREVRAPLTERIGTFKERHFASDLADNKLIRLIFNGHILKRDNSTLRECGLFHNCVVHCLVHQREQQQPGGNSSGGGSGTTNRGREQDLDLSYVCYPLLGAVLAAVWYLQISYSQYFNFTSSISLVSLTVLFFASIANSFFA